MLPTPDHGFQRRIGRRCDSPELSQEARAGEKPGCPGSAARAVPGSFAAVQATRGQCVRLRRDGSRPLPYPVQTLLLLR